MAELDSSRDGVSRREVIKKSLKLGGAVYVAPVVLAAVQPASVLAQVTPTPRPPAPTPLPSACNLPLERGLATQGTGTAGTTQTTTVCAGTGGYRQTFQVVLNGATPNTAFDVYIDQESVGDAAAHIFAGTFTTDASGNAFFTASIIVPTPATVVDNEIVLQGAPFTAHQFIQQSFAPCPVAC